MKRLLLILFIIIASPCLATQYYVSDSGNDANNGTAIGTPFRYAPGMTSCSNNCAAAEAALAGDDIVSMNRGDSWSGQVLTIPQSGTAGHPITYNAYGTGNLPLLYRLVIQEQDYITVNDLRFYVNTAGGANRAAVTADTTGVVIEDCTFDVGSSATPFDVVTIGALTTHLTFRGNTVDGSAVTSNTNSTDGLAMVAERPSGYAGNISHVLIENNTITGGSHSTFMIHTNDSVSTYTITYCVVRNNIIQAHQNNCLDVAYNVQYVLFEGNTIIGCDDCSLAASGYTGLFIENASYNIIRKNLLRDHTTVTATGIIGLGVYYWDDEIASGSSPTTKYSRIYNNTLHNIGNSSTDLVFFVGENEGTYKNNVDLIYNDFRNNIIDTTDGYELRLDKYTPTGSHDGGNNICDDEACVMTDSGEAFGVDQLIGKTINNTTDGSSCTVTDNSETTITCAVALAGEGDNDWDTNDVWTLSPEAIHDNTFYNNQWYVSGVSDILRIEDPEGSYSNKSVATCNTDYADFDGNLQTDPNLDANHRPQAGSDAIDGGAWLTTITSATGSGASFVVGDASYFVDADDEWGGIVDRDTLQIEGNPVVYTITAINYGTNTITVTPSASWTNGDGVSMPYGGSAPDIGFYEQDIPDEPGQGLFSGFSVGGTGSISISGSGTGTITIGSP